MNPTKGRFRPPVDAPVSRLGRDIRTPGGWPIANDNLGLTHAAGDPASTARTDRGQVPRLRAPAEGAAKAVLGPARWRNCPALLFWPLPRAISHRCTASDV